MRIIHVGDLHFSSVPVNPFKYFGKRSLGVGNLLVGGRIRRFRTEHAPALASFIQERKPDVLFFSGDFSTTAVRSEFEKAREIFDNIVQKNEVSVYTVPGNHDCYTRSQVSAPLMRNVLGEKYQVEETISLHRLPGQDVGVLAINAGTSNGLGSHGELKKVHEDFIKNELVAEGKGLKALHVLCHFPAEEPKPLLKHDRGIQLRNADGLLKKLNELAIPVVWHHGHHHYRWVFRSPRYEKIIYLNAGAPLMRSGEKVPDLGFHEVNLEKGQNYSFSTWSRFIGEDWKEHHFAPPDEGFLDLQKRQVE